MLAKHPHNEMISFISSRPKTSERRAIQSYEMIHAKKIKKNIKNVVYRVII